jgi:hypothetical protein
MMNNQWKAWLVAGCASIAAIAGIGSAQAGPGGAGPYGPWNSDGWPGFGPYQRFVAAGLPPHEIPIGEVTVTETTTRVIRHHGRVRVLPPGVTERTEIVTVERGRRPMIGGRIVARRTIQVVRERQRGLQPVAEQVIVEPRRYRGVPTVIEDAATMPAPTVAPGYSNAWVDYANPYR